MIIVEYAKEMDNPVVLANLQTNAIQARAILPVALVSTQP
jgi:hypothetical protein